MKLKDADLTLRKAAAIVGIRDPGAEVEHIQPAAPRGAEIARDTVIATVNGTPITVADMSRAADLTWDRINGRPVRKHNRAWRDTTRTARTRARLGELDDLARRSGYPSWSAFETAAKTAGEAGATVQIAPRAADDPATVIVTRHVGLVAWLEARGIAGTVIAQATPADVQGKRVIGALPLHLAALADEVIAIDMPNLTAEQRGRDLTPAEMDAAGATMTRYTVRRPAR